MDRRFDSLAKPIADLIKVDRSMELGPGSPDTEMRAKLAGLSVDQLFDGFTVVDPIMAKAVVSSLWLYHDFLDESHAISQSIDNPTGCYLHGIMHRREGDYSNAKYWFRRVGKHPIEDDLLLFAKQLTLQSGLPSSEVDLSSQPTWSHVAFVDLVESVVGRRSKVEELCRSIQAIELAGLMRHAYQLAVGR